MNTDPANAGQDYSGYFREISEMASHVAEVGVFSLIGLTVILTVFFEQASSGTVFTSLGAFGFVTLAFSSLLINVGAVVLSFYLGGSWVRFRLRVYRKPTEPKVSEEDFKGLWDREQTLAGAAIGLAFQGLLSAVLAIGISLFLIPSGLLAEGVPVAEPTPNLAATAFTLSFFVSLCIMSLAVSFSLFPLFKRLFFRPISELGAQFLTGLPAVLLHFFVISVVFLGASSPFVIITGTAPRYSHFFTNLVNLFSSILTDVISKQQRPFITFMMAPILVYAVMYASIALYQAKLYDSVVRGYQHLLSRIRTEWGGGNKWFTQHVLFLEAWQWIGLALFVVVAAYYLVS